MEELLGEVFGLLGGVAAAADVEIDGTPVGVTEFLQGVGALCVFRIPCGEDHAPAGAGEDAAGIGLGGGRAGAHWRDDRANGRWKEGE